MWLLVVTLYAYNHPLALRILPPLPTALFLLASILNAATIALGTYLRAAKREPQSLIYLSSAVATIVVASSLSQQFGAEGVIGAYLFVVALLQFPLSLVTFLRNQYTS